MVDRASGVVLPGAIEMTECPRCDEPDIVEMDFETLGTEVQCPRCGVRYVVTGEDDYEGFSFWLEEA